VSSSVRIRTTGSGYRYVEVVEEDGRSSIPAHRVLSYGWGDLDSALFSEDMREIHHRIPIPWLNTEENLEPLTPEAHRARDARRREIAAPWDRGAPIASDGGDL